MSKLKNSKNLSDEFINRLAEISAGYLTSDSFENLISIIKLETSGSYFGRNSESNLLRIISSRFDKISFLNDCVKYPNYVEILIAVSKNSNYLTDILVRDPENFYWISSPSNLSAEINEKSFSKSLSNSLSSYKSFDAKVNALRIIKRKELLRIGLKDILGFSDLKEISRLLSILAKVITAELFSVCYTEILKKNKILPTSDKAEKKSSYFYKYCLLALGKLGGCELNYSSDVDLMIFYDKDQKIGKKYFYEILTEAVHLFIESSSSITGSGFIYRIDFRLRPDGKASPLCGSAASYLNYYESRGEDWERQMLIKARLISGSKKLYENFINHLLPFIYPAAFSISPTEQIKRLKSNIEKNLSGAENIKLQPGGIRDIEFSVQALQLINGGSLPEIRTGNTLEAIEKLHKNNLLSKKEFEIFISAYVFYRKIEHFLQLMNNEQTHLIPSNGETLKELASYLNFQNPAEFKDALNKKRKEVRIIYLSIIRESKPELKKTKHITEIKFEKPQNAKKDIEFLREGKNLLGQKLFDKNSISAFQKIEDDLINYLKTSINPDLVLQNFARVIKYSTLHSIWYREFADKNFFYIFLKLCEFSQKTIDMFGEDKSLQEYFLTRKVFLKPDINEFKNFETKKILFTLSLQFALGLINFQRSSKFISEFFKEKIKEASSEINGSLIQIDKRIKFFIAALGSFASSEMTFASDIDLIFVVDSPVSGSDYQKKFQDLLLKLKNDFKPFDVDCRLRPEGESSQLVWELEGYKKYIRNRARTWEFQAFTKLNFITGDKALFNTLIREITNTLKAKTFNLKDDILSMRKKLYPGDLSSLTKLFNIRKSRGGTADIEFIVQLLLLGEPENLKKCLGKGNLLSLDFLSKNKKQRDEFVTLKENYVFLKTLEMFNQNIFNVSSPVLSENNKTDKILALRMSFESGIKFRNHLRKIINLNSSLFNKYFLSR